ncbi:MAG: hypothetical protein J7L53_08495 [Deltaproteobacteria bacterium]|nr:hypothetical protein [Deltaproteobacteria bacterium]
MFDVISGDMERYYGHKASPVEFMTFFVHPRTQAMAFFRMSQWCVRHGLKPFGMILETLNIILWGCELSPKMEIGKGFILKHTLSVGLGFSKAGENLTVYMGVSVGSAQGEAEYDETGRPRLGNNVTIYDSAKIFGGVTIGDNVIIGTNSVVMKSVPSNCIVAGSPARIIRHLPGYVPPDDPENYCKDISKINEQV